MTLGRSIKILVMASLAIWMTTSSVFAQSKLSSKLEQYRANADAYLKTDAKLAARISQIPETNPVVTITNKDGTTQQITLMGRDWVKESLGASLSFVKSEANQRRVYRFLYNKLPTTKRASLKLPTPDALAKQSGVQVAAWNRIILKGTGITSSVSTDTAPASYPGDACDAEVGYEDGSDCMYSSGAFCLNYLSVYPFSSNGLYSRYSFSLKYDLTCVKNQGSRGSCSSFAVTAAVEAEAAKQFGEWYNLSEQHLYWYYKKHIENDGDQDSDGADTHDLMVETASSALAHRKESVWNYNPSYDRDTDTSGNYADSCVDYAGEKCSDTVHQGMGTHLSLSIPVVSFGLGTKPTDATAPDPTPSKVIALSSGLSSIAARGETGFLAGGATELWDASDPDASLKLAADYLSAERPVVASVDATNQFVYYPDADGYVTYTSGDTSLGGHAVLLVGFITSADLYPDSTTDRAASTAQTGGGYFMIKNSWGITYGDRGFVYVPYNWAKEHVYGLNLLDEGLTEVDAASAPDSFPDDWKE